MKGLSEAAERNKEPIANILKDYLPSKGLVLEIASGTGQHVVHFARRFSDLTWQPSDILPERINSIESYREETQLQNIRKPLILDVLKPWPIERANLVLSLNLIHIAPRAVCPALFEGAHRVLGPGQILMLYGPYRLEEGKTAPSNLQFEKWLLDKDPDFGLWEVDKLKQIGAETGFAFEQMIAMPANNHCLIFRK